MAFDETFLYGGRAKRPEAFKSIEDKDTGEQVKKHFYLSKVFLSPDSMKSMAAIQCKIKLNGEYGIRISDCNKTIKIWGNIETDRDEALEKIDALITELRKFRNHINVNYEK